MYTSREEWLNAFIDAARPVFAATGHPIPINVRIAVGFTSRGTRGSRIGEAWSSDASADGHFEIFIKPTLADATLICAVLTHELVHVTVGLAAGHGPLFRRVAMQLGLGGPMTATEAKSEWYKWALPIVSALGPLPYAPLDGGISSSRKKQDTYLLKTVCSECGWTARVTRKHVHADMLCPIRNCSGELETEE